LNPHAFGQTCGTSDVGCRGKRAPLDEKLKCGFKHHSAAVFSCFNVERIASQGYDVVLMKRTASYLTAHSWAKYPSEHRSWRFSPAGKIRRMKKAPSQAPVRPPRPPRARLVQSHEVRIIGGLWKRSKLQVADKPGLRPTPDRVRETLFNWLGQDLSGWHCLDAFAGTGVLGFEDASRGAKQVQLVEKDAALVEQLKKMQAHLKADAVQVLRGDGVAALRHATGNSLELIFLDPPFDSALFESAVMAAAQAVTAGGFVYLEAPKKWLDAQLQPLGLRLHRHLKAGMVHAHLLQRLSTTASPAG